MQPRKTWRYAGLAAMLALVLIVGPYALTAQGSVVSSTVSGQLNEQFAKHYLELQVIDTSQPVTIKMDYQPQHSNSLDENSGFYVFKQSGYDRYLNASPPSETVFRTGSLESMGGIKRKVTEIGAGDASEIVSIVVYNDTTMALAYTLTGENVTFVDESGEQVVSGTTPSAPATSTPTHSEREAAAATTPEAVVTTSAVRSTWVRGELNEQFAKHYLGLEVVDTGQPVKIKMVYDPQNSQQVDDSAGFYVFKQAGYDRYLNAAPPSDSVYLTGSLETMDGIKRKVGEIGVDNVSEIVALVTYNDTTMPFSYTVTGENVLFLDDSGEQVEGDRVVVQQPAAETGAAPASGGTDITLGGTYTVQTGDTLGTISTQGLWQYYILVRHLFLQLAFELRPYRGWRRSEHSDAGRRPKQFAQGEQRRRPRLQMQCPPQLPRRHRMQWPQLPPRHRMQWPGQPPRQHQMRCPRPLQRRRQRQCQSRQAKPVRVPTISSKLRRITSNWTFCYWRWTWLD